MNRIELQDDGTHYYRADFQVHTPRDANWDGPRPRTEDERVAWAKSFLAAARENQLNAVAISDHHDFAMYPYVRQAALDEVDNEGTPILDKERLVVFPALELTLQVPCQAILILDADFPLDRLDDVLKALHHEPFNAAARSLPTTTVLPKSDSIPNVCAQLDLKPWLKGRYILLPNVTPSGHKSLIRDSFQDKYKDALTVCVAGYLDGSVAILEKKPGKATILEGRDGNWGDRPIALFQTSDSRKSDFAELGSAATWVKWSRPTAEALRQASLARESRISHAEPAVPNVWISRVVVSHSKFMGRLDSRLNPQYTAIIGGRGTGKSSVLDYMRWALGDQVANTGEEDELVDPRARQRRLINATLVPYDAVVEVYLVINGVPHVVRRHAKSGEFELQVGDEDFATVHETIVQRLLPVQAYSQKQLSSVAIRVDELTRFLETPILRQLEDIDRRHVETQGRLRENYGTLQRHRSVTREMEQSRARIKSLTGQAQALRDGLTGLSEADRMLLDHKAGHDQAATAVAAWRQQLAALEVETEALRSAYRRAANLVSVHEDAPEELKADLGIAVTAIHKALQQAEIALGTIGDSLSVAVAPSGSIDASLGAVDRRLTSFNERYGAVKERSTAHETKLRQLAELEYQINEATDLLGKQELECGRLGDPAGEHDRFREKLRELNSERSQALQTQCVALSAASDQLIRASLEVGHNFAEVQSKFRGLVTGSGLRGNKIENLFDMLKTDKDPATTWEAILAELELVMLLEPDGELTSELAPTLSRLGFTVTDLQRIKPKITPEAWLDLSLTPLVDQPVFEYQSKPGTYIPFSSASAGQQATALLTTLLTQDGMPLLIDQPEEDLDSETVQHIVAKIWEAKGRRQLILASHNANLVVNGDADLVLVCGYTTAGDQSAGTIKSSGAIDQPEIRDAITTVMEGGEKAFRLRKEKYGF
ncbi:TrlF family AAA-like ATPase [Dietzia cercidiphylli]|uniref:TrlF family AAA-like ATPase n=1 Tax=Dietzia cercidiphylli TaxID=498199 RepID=UPI0015FA7869|nr:AAA family ATPase [Dietzia cercidiphylli]MBB1046522.1 AAA family ATPase [Dietzia cercidiphylli]